jgi:RNA polymerase sigma factor (sigma-70 family)
MNRDLDMLAPAIADGEKQAFALWMAHCEMPLRLSLASFARRVDVESVLQETLIRLWRFAPQFIPDGKPNGLFRLAVRVARNLAISELRKRKEEPGSDTDLDVVDLERNQASDFGYPDPVLQERIRLCFDDLPEAPRSALCARLQSAGNAADEVLAEQLRMKPNTFLQNFTRARKFLAACLQKYGIDVGQGHGALAHRGHEGAP